MTIWGISLGAWIIIITVLIILTGSGLIIFALFKFFFGQTDTDDERDTEYYDGWR